MASAVTLTSRNIVVEDFLPGVATFAQTTGTVLGLGPGITITPLVVAVSDAAAAAAGCPVGCLYINNGGSFNYLRTRMS
jgi:hypothetical protein